MIYFIALSKRIFLVVIRRGNNSRTIGNCSSDCTGSCCTSGGIGNSGSSISSIVVAVAVVLLSLVVVVVVLVVLVTGFMVLVAMLY